MPDTILHQGNCFTIALVSEAETAVPYGPVNHEDGNVNHGFVDLRGRPELVDQIAEAIGKPSFIRLLKYINSDTSPLMTIGCATAVFPVENQFPDGPTCYVGSYIDIVFRSPEASTKESVIELAANIIEERKPEAQQGTSFELIIQPMHHFFGKAAYNLNFKILAFGCSEPEAWNVFNAQCDEMAVVVPRALARGSM